MNFKFKKIKFDFRLAKCFCSEALMILLMMNFNFLLKQWPVVKVVQMKFVFIGY
jgi:hypothetical protein